MKHPPDSIIPESPHQPEPEDSVTGTVESIVFRNDESGYTVCTIRTPAKRGMREDFLTIVGSCAAIWEGEELHAEGSWIRHPSHGRQFQAETITCIAPTSTEGIRRYLAGGMTEADILADFPSLRAEHIRACLAFAAQRERRLTMGNPHEIAA